MSDSALRTRRWHRVVACFKAEEEAEVSLEDWGLSESPATRGNVHFSRSGGRQNPTLKPFLAISS